jgi:hypothetical protein
MSSDHDGGAGWPFTDAEKARAIDAVNEYLQTLPWPEAERNAYYESTVLKALQERGINLALAEETLRRLAAKKVIEQVGIPDVVWGLFPAVCFSLKKWWEYYRQHLEGRDARRQAAGAGMPKTPTKQSGKGPPPPPPPPASGATLLGDQHTPEEQIEEVMRQTIKEHGSLKANRLVELAGVNRQRGLAALRRLADCGEYEGLPPGRPRKQS